MDLNELAKVVKSNYEKLQESEIVGRIAVLSGRSFERSVKGLEVLKNEGLIENFVDPETEGKLGKLLANNPLINELCEKLDLIPGKTISDQKPKKSKKAKKYTIEKLKKNLNLDDRFSID
jgi:hypothetical protein